MFFKRISYFVTFIIYCVIVIAAVFMQNGRKHITAANIDVLVNIIPFKNTLHDIRHLLVRGLKGNMNLFINIAGNIILFVPLSFFLINLFKIQKLFHILLIALLLSFVIECIQYVFLLGVPDIDDIILNLAGAYMGWLFFHKAYSDQNV